MKNQLLYIAMLIVFLLYACDEKCSDTVVPEHITEFKINVEIVDNAGNFISDYPVKITIQKIFCDGDVGLPITEEGVTSEDGIFWTSQYWPIPYTNSKDVVKVYYYAGTGENELGYSQQYGYSSDRPFVAEGHRFTVSP